MVQLDDVKVLTANFTCMVMLNLSNMNTDLQSVLFLATIGYTLVRTVNEIQKFRNKDGKADSIESNRSEENKD